MYDLIKYVQCSLDSFSDSIVESFSSFLIQEYPEFFTKLCDEIRSSENV